MEDHFFGEYVEYLDCELEEAELYLKSWSKFLKRKIPDMEHIETTDFILREYSENFLGDKFPNKTIAMKVTMRGKLPEDLKLSNLL